MNKCLYCDTKIMHMCLYYKTSLLRRLQAQTLHNATPPLGQIHLFSKIALNFWTTNGILMPFGIKKVLDHYDIVCFITWRAISNRLGVAAPYSCGRKRLTDSLNQWIMRLFVEQPLALPGSAKYYILQTRCSGGCSTTSLLRRLQAPTLSDEAPPVGKIYPFRKIAITFEPVQRFWCPSIFSISEKISL